MPYFSNDRLNWPQNGDLNAWADFVETLTLFSEDHHLSTDDFIDYLLDDDTKTLAEILSAINFNEHFLSLPDPTGLGVATVDFPITGQEIKEEEDSDIEDDYSGDDKQNEDREKINSRLLRLFRFLFNRKHYFDSWYPFDITRGTSIQLLNDLTDIQKMYQVLLLFSEMQIYSYSDRNRIGHRFEALCRVPFEYLTPVASSRKFFGAGGGSIIASDYQGSLLNKLTGLANDLNISVNPNINDPDELGSNGDAGLDWVGWQPFGDAVDHQPVYFGQCACGADWIDKQNETSLSIWHNYLAINQSVQCFHFMPRSFRRDSLGWFRRTMIQQELTLIDRYRLLYIFAQIDVVLLSEILVDFNDVLDDANEFFYATEN